MKPRVTNVGAIMGSKPNKDIFDLPPVFRPVICRHNLESHYPNVLQLVWHWPILTQRCLTETCYDGAGSLALEMLRAGSLDKTLDLINCKANLLRASLWKPRILTDFEFLNIIQSYVEAEASKNVPLSVHTIIGPKEFDRKAYFEMAGLAKSEANCNFRGVRPEFYSEKISPLFNSFLLKQIQFRAGMAYLILQNQNLEIAHEVSLERPSDILPILPFPNNPDSHTLAFLKRMNCLRILANAGLIFATRSLSLAQIYSPELKDQLNRLCRGYSNLLGPLLIPFTQK